MRKTRLLLHTGQLGTEPLAFYYEDLFDFIYDLSSKDLDQYASMISVWYETFCEGVSERTVAEEVVSGFELVFELIGMKRASYQ